MPKRKIITEINGPVSTIIINRPEVRNALDQEASAELAQHLKNFAADETQKVAVLTGEGGSFCAGADLKETAKRADYKAWAGHPEGPLHKRLDKPIIAAIEGHAVAGGLGVALYCDIRIASKSAVFGVFCRRWGVPMSDGTPTRLPRIIGEGPAMDMMLSGEPINATRALELGLVTRLTDEGQALEEAQQLAHQIASFPELAMLSDRHALISQAGLEEAKALKIEWDAAQEAQAKEAQVGAKRFADGAGRHGSFAD
ncbi:crotonase/enoyl-CoA hydratase family protein [Sneathiella glossodoripedis]|uniref:crotonase/enoyl-CoA hydratase family protein n=1 Tax=Sneathiella glossodoripedis TaxID=418853 RepID=UPI0004728851|nr:crotonase/enoyl-CoA hydratase family protein [Sneathiella glossodoripedis]